MKIKNKKGFTLVELLVVIAIIGILAVVAVPALFKNIEKGKVADLEADISAIRSAALSVYADSSEFPAEGDIESKTGDKNHDIFEELEGLSKPFGGTYLIDNDTTNESRLVISINDSEISQSGMEKLKNDLGNKIDSESTGKNIIITLISK